GSNDPDGDPIVITWDLDNDGQYDDASGPTASRTYPAGTHTPSVRVSDNHAHSATKSFTISSGNTPPQPVIDTPVAGTNWAVGQNLSFSGHATDGQDGNLAASRLSWRWIMHHCTGQGECHVHVIQDIAGAAGGTFQAPDHEYPSYLELQLTATDSGGLTTTVTRDFQPRSVNLTFATNPSGLQLSAGTQTAAAPFMGTFIVGSHFTVDAPASQALNNTTYLFSSWSDAGARSHTVTAPATNTTYTAQYTSGSSADAPNKCAAATTTSTQGTWLRNSLSSTSDKDWYRFSVGSTGWVRILLGNLGGNYRIDLYKACSTLKFTSNRSGSESEEIYAQLSAGTYRVRVSAASGATVNPQQEFGLKFSTYATGLHILSSSAWTSGSNLNIDGEVLNNTADRHRLIGVTATLYDSAGQVLATRGEWAWINVLPGRNRSPFHIALARPAGYHHYSVAVNYSQVTTDQVVGNLPISSSTRGTDGSGIWFRGSFTNQNAFLTHWTTSLTTLYDTWGDVMNTDTSWASPIDVPSQVTGSYEARFSEHYQGWNRAAVVMQGSP
ncbi:MAG: hypothetical protein ABI797_05260, partial [Chloroflexota bacterium]